MARILARAAAMQLVYERLEGGEAEETLTDLIGFNQDAAGGESAFNEDSAFIRTLVDGVKEHEAELDGLITRYLRDWTIDRIARVDLSILRIAFYSLLYERETAPAIIIKEAVDMATRYSTDKSGAFVNGVLSAYMKDAG